MQIKITDFVHRLEENVETLKNHLEENKFCANDYHFFDHPKEDNHFLITRRFFDIVAATAIGALPVDQLSGVDCYRTNFDPFVQDKGKVINVAYEPVEVKLVELHTRGLFKSDAGALYYGRAPTRDSNKRTSIRSNFKASFEIYNNIDDKNMTTVLVMFDTESHQFIDAFELTGDDVYKFLNYKLCPSGSGKIIGNKTTCKRKILLSTFIKHGKRIDLRVPTIGFENWEADLKQASHIPLIR